MMKCMQMASLLGMAVLVAPAPAAEEAMELTVGESKSVTLAGNPTTGFLWQVAECPDVVVVELAFEQRKPEPNEPPLCGRPCGTVVAVTGTKVGQGTVKLIYSRPWEKGEPPFKTHTLNVSVK